jgi:hypothetical protein
VDPNGDRIFFCAPQYPMPSPVLVKGSRVFNVYMIGMLVLAVAAAWSMRGGFDPKAVALYSGVAAALFLLAHHAVPCLVVGGCERTAFAFNVFVHASSVLLLVKALSTPAAKPKPY